MEILAFLGELPHEPAQLFDAICRAQASTLDAGAFWDTVWTALGSCDLPNDAAAATGRG